MQAKSLLLGGIVIGLAVAAFGDEGTQLSAYWLSIAYHYVASKLCRTSAS